MPIAAIRATSVPSEWSDRMLLRRVLRRDEVAWSELVRRYRALVYRCIAKVTLKLAPALCRADLDDIYAEVLMSLYRNDMHKLRQFDPARGTKLGTWIGMISINAAHDYLRSASRAPLLDRIDGSQEAHSGPQVESERTALDVLLEKERWTHLNEILAAFSSKDRTFLDLYYARGLDAAVVAREMDISLKTVYSKKHKIRAHLRRCLGQTSGESAIADLASAAA